MKTTILGVTIELTTEEHVALDNELGTLLNTTTDRQRDYPVTTKLFQSL